MLKLRLSKQPSAVYTHMYVQFYLTSVKIPQLVYVFMELITSEWVCVKTCTYVACCDMVIILFWRAELDLRLLTSHI